MQNHNKSNLHVFYVVYHVIISYSFKEFAKKRACFVFAAILEIYQDALHVVAAEVQTLHFNVFFKIKHTQI